MRAAAKLTVVVALAMTACGSDTPLSSAAAEPPAIESSDLPRTTGEGIELTMIESVETLPMPGCHTYWLFTFEEEPPPGACVAETTIRRFTAMLNGQTGDASVQNYPETRGPDSFSAMRVVERSRGGDVSIALVVPPADASIVRLVDRLDHVVDEVTPGSRLIALAGIGSRFTVEALASDGSVIVSCPPDGVKVDMVNFPCTLKPGVTPPVTTNAP